MGDTPIPPAEGDSPSALPLVAAGPDGAAQNPSLLISDFLTTNARVQRPHLEQRRSFQLPPKPSPCGLMKSAGNDTSNSLPQLRQR